MQGDMQGSRWALGLWGAFSVIFGMLILAWPGITLKALLILLGIYLLASGVVMSIGSLMGRKGHWVGGTIMGILSVLAGLYIFSNPALSGLAILTVIAIWAIAVGCLQVVAGFEGKNDWLMIIAGVIYALFGFYIFAHPAGGALTIVWLIGLSTIFSGILLVIGAFKSGGSTPAKVKA